MRRERKKVFAELNMVPYLDVMLVLLVIFMVAIPTTPWGIKVALPKVAESGKTALKDPPSKSLMLTVNANGERKINEKGRDEVLVKKDQSLALVLKNKGIEKDHAVYIKAEGKASWENVLAQMVELKGLGFEMVTFLVQKSSK